MKTLAFILAFFTIATVTISCKDDAKENRVEETITKEKEEKVEMKQREPKTLTQEQKDNSNAIMNKLMLNKDISQFSRALVTAGLMSNLSDLSQEYTVLAPKNEVFEALPKGKNIVTDPGQREALISLLNMHIVQGTISSADMVQEIQKNSKLTLTTLSGKKLVATMDGDEIKITNPLDNQSVRVGKSDVQGTNGVLHVVDGFLQ
ncbi:MAG: fasciclin domain-containing protein [Marinirhabdus sp.]|nr:fasciclin domain-containing protein [Marinirhabdus sp.]